jgi:hypothetical protein
VVEALGSSDVAERGLGDDDALSPRGTSMVVGMMTSLLAAAVMLIRLSMIDSAGVAIDYVNINAVHSTAMR